MSNHQLFTGLPIDPAERYVGIYTKTAAYRKEWIAAGKGEFPGLAVWEQLKPLLEESKEDDGQWRFWCTEEEYKNAEQSHDMAEKENSNSCIHFMLQLMRLQRKKGKSFHVLLGQLAYNFGQLQTCYHELPADLLELYQMKVIHVFQSVNGLVM